MSLRQLITHYMRIGLQYQPFEVYKNAFDSLSDRDRRRLSRAFINHRYLMERAWGACAGQVRLYEHGWRAILTPQGLIDFVDISNRMVFLTDITEDRYLAPECPGAA